MTPDDQPRCSCHLYPLHRDGKVYSTCKRAGDWMRLLWDLAVAS